MLGITGREDEIDDVVSDLRVNEDVDDQFARFADRIKGSDGDNVQIWRDSMLELLRLEDPSRDQRGRMSRRFNDAYGEVEERFPRCTSDARRYAQQLGDDGADLTDEMARSLR